MSVRFDWARLAESERLGPQLVDLLNHHLETVLAQHEEVRSYVRNIRVSALSWGESPPFVQLVDIADAPQSVGPDAPPGDPDDLFGESGLLVRVHCTYSGDARLVLEAEACFGIPEHPLLVSLPVLVELTNIKVDAEVAVAYFNHEVRVWLEEREGSVLRDVGLHVILGCPEADVPLFIEREKISHFVKAELRELLRTRLVSPNFVSFKL
eukprot:TRINITY_DN11581_c0_g1_i3.p1 TRINITY_DN11581_c0_g1~~TRINITY_DN11581_c0_g1_i3.p1  ORF type:complete len:210 (-),score=39.43 TRINITY_DN11581_c0_g1_i3:15-644(-)